MINNTFFDTETQLSILIPFKRQLQKLEAEIITRHIFAKQKEMLYYAWKAQKENKEWTGDIEAKQTELFLNYHKSKAPILVFEYSTEEVLKAYPQTSE